MAALLPHKSTELFGASYKGNLEIAICRITLGKIVSWMINYAEPFSSWHYLYQASYHIAYYSKLIFNNTSWKQRDCVCIYQCALRLIAATWSDKTLPVVRNKIINVTDTVTSIWSLMTFCRNFRGSKERTSLSILIKGKADQEDGLILLTLVLYAQRIEKCGGPGGCPKSLSSAILGSAGVGRLTQCVYAISRCMKISRLVLLCIIFSFSAFFVPFQSKIRKKNYEDMNSSPNQSLAPMNSYPHTVFPSWFIFKWTYITLYCDFLCLLNA